jgi:hypothetical protein
MNGIKRILDAVSENGQEHGDGRRVRLAASAGLMAASLLFMVYTVYRGWDTLQEHLAHLNYWLLGAALLAYPLGFIPVLWGWHTIMGRVGGCQDIRTNVRLYSLSCLPRRIPGSIWYIASRLVLYRERQVSYGTTLAATAIETVLLVLSGLIIYVLSLLLTPAQLNPRLRGAAAVALVLAVGVVAWAPILNRGLRWLLGRLGIPGTVDLRPRHVLRILGVFGLAWVGGGLVLYILVSGVTALLAGQLPLLIGVWGAAGAISLVAGLLVQGMGLREVTLAVLLSGYVPLPVAVVISILFRLVLTVGELMWALIFAGLATVHPD